MSSSLFDPYRAELRKRRVAAVWRGYGSAIFLEIGELRPRRKRDGSEARPDGEYTIMIEWSWRIETESEIVAGSWSEEANWNVRFNSLIGLQVEDVTLIGRLPELLIRLEGGLYVSSFMTADGQPAWTILKRAADGNRPTSLSVSHGRVVEASD